MNIDDMINNKVISTQSFTNFADSFPSSYKGNPTGSGSGNISFEYYLNKKVQSIINNCPNYDINF